MHAGDFDVMFDLAAHLTGEMRNVDQRKRIGAFDDQEIARAEPGKRLAGAQRRQRALQPFEIETRGGNGHGERYIFTSRRRIFREAFRAKPAPMESDPCA